MSAPINCTNIELVGVAIRLLLGCVLLVAGSLKMVDRSALKSSIHALGLSSSGLLTTSLTAVPATEILLGAWLFLSLWPAVALIVTTLLFTGFTFVLFVLIRRGYSGNCACFGTVDRHPIGLVQLARNIVLVLAAAFALTLSFSSACMELTVWNLSPLMLVMTLIAFIVVSGIYALAGEVEAFFKHAASQPLPAQREGGKYG